MTANNNKALYIGTFLLGAVLFLYLNVLLLYAKENNMAGIYPIASQADGSIKYSDGSIKYPGSSATDSNYANYQPAMSQVNYQQPSGPQGPITSGDVLDSNTGGGNSGGGGPAGSPNDNKPGMFWDAADGWKPINSGPNENQIRNEISSAWDGYINSLDQQFGMLDKQKAGMEGQVVAQANKFKNQLGLQLGQGKTALEGERTKTESAQKKNFQDLAEDQTNQMRAGNIYLGARGAGDSSAADMYSYAIGRQGSQIRGDLMQQTAGTLNEINVREENLNNIYNTEVNNTQEELNNGLSQIAQWYADSQRQIQQMKGEAGRDKGLSLAQMSYEILNQAKARVQQLQNYAIEKQAALQQWALNNSNTLAQAKANLQGVANFSAPELNRGQIQGPSVMPGQSRPSGYAPIGMGSNTDEKKNLTSLFQ